MKLPRYTATTSPPRISGLARAQNIGALTQTGDVIKAQGIQEIGTGLGAAAKAAYKSSLMDAENALSDFQTNTVEEINAFGYSLNENIKADTYDKEFDKVLSKIRSMMPEDKRAAREAQLWLNDQMPVWRKAVQDSKLRRSRDNWQKIDIRLQQRVIKSEDFEHDTNLAIYTARLWNGVERGVYTSTQAEKMLQDTIEQHEQYVRVETARTQREQKAAKDEAQRKAGTNFLVRLWEGELKDPQEITEALEADILDVPFAKYLREALISEEPAKLDLKTYADALVLTNEFREKRTLENRDKCLSHIFENLDKIDPATGKSLVADIISVEKPEDAIKSVPAQIYFNNLADLYKEETISALQYDMKYRTLKSYIENNPNAPPEQRAKFYEELMEDTTTFNWLDLLWWQKGMIKNMSMKLKVSEIKPPTSEEEFKRTVSEIEDEKEALKYYNKWKDKW